MAQSIAVAPPRLIHSRPAPKQLGDMLQRLATISPDDVHAITKLTRDVLNEAEKEYALRFPKGGFPY